MGKTKGLTSALQILQPRQVLEAEAGDLADGGGLVLRVSAAGAS